MNFGSIGMFFMHNIYFYMMKIIVFLTVQNSPKGGAILDKKDVLRNGLYKSNLCV